MRAVRRIGRQPAAMQGGGGDNAVREIARRAQRHAAAHALPGTADLIALHLELLDSQSRKAPVSRVYFSGSVEGMSLPKSARVTALAIGFASGRYFFASSRILLCSRAFGSAQPRIISPTRFGRVKTTGRPRWPTFPTAAP